MSVEWWSIRNQSLALAAREAGFDLNVYNDYSENVREELEAKAIKHLMRNLADDFENETGRKLSEIKEGVYVICISTPFTIKYGEFCSNIIYIGRGNIGTRLKSHFERSLFRFMTSLLGSNFDFYLTDPGKRPSEAYFKHLEFDLLENFREKIGDGSYPLLNKNAGSDQGLTTREPGWNKPLKSSGKKPIWALEKTQFWDISKLG